MNSVKESILTTQHERDQSTGLDYRGARYYDADVARFLSLDPLASQFPSWSDYNYVMGNPVMFIDPDGRAPESTHIDEYGNVVDVKNDGDLGVYQHDKSGEVRKVGETEHWDEFVSPETGKPMTNTTIQVGKSFDPIISEMSKKADGMGLYQIAQESRPGGGFDIKGPYENIGGLLNGKYVTSRSAGNYLAGYNANNGVINYTTFQKVAGKLHQQGFSTKEAIKTVLYGDHIGTAPTYGENMYQYRMSIQGWSDKGKTGSNINLDQFKRTPTNGLKW